MNHAKTGKRFLGLLILGLVFLGAHPAMAYKAVGESDNLEIPMQTHDLHGFRSALVRQSRTLAESSLAARYDGRWTVYSWNPQTGTPQSVYGTPARLAASVSSAAELDDLARQVIVDNRSVLGADTADLRLDATPNALGKWVAHYQQTYQGLDVHGGRVQVAISEAGKLILMGSEFYSDIELDTQPTLTHGLAEILAKSALPFNPATDGIEEDGKLLVLPVPRSATSVEQHLVWRIRVHTESPLGTWVTHVDAHDGTILWRYNDIHFDYQGGTQSDVQPNTYCDGVEEQAMPYLDIDISGLGTTTSDSDGDWNIAGSGANRSVGADLYGPYCNITNLGGAEAQYDGIAQDGVSHMVVFDDSNSQPDERDVFDAVNDIHDFFQVIAPEFNLPHTRMQANVSRTGGLCPGNAWWNGTINFCAASGEWANTGEIQGVVHHEFGHGIQAAILGSQGSQGLGEGNGDIIQNLMTNEALIGRGFTQDECNSGIRSSNNTLRYPEDVIGIEIHAAGQVIAGFHWDALTSLQNAFGTETGTNMMATTWHYGRILMHPQTQPAQVLATFMADDDDNDLSNGTPNYAAYCYGAERHGFSCPVISTGVLMTHLSLDDTDDASSGIPVEISASSTEGSIVNASVKVFWRHNDGLWNEIAMTSGGLGNFTATLPANPYGEVEYYFYAEDNVGTSGTLPVGAPAGVFRYQVAIVADHAESVGGWTVGDPADNASAGIWVNVDPVGTSAQPEDDHTNYGTNCWVTGQHETGQADNWGDVDGGKTTLFSEVYDLTGMSNVRLSWYQWFEGGVGDYLAVKFSNDAGATWATYTTFLEPSDGWDQRTRNWDFYFPQPELMMIKWTAADNATETLMEAAVDDLVILADITTGTSDDGFSVAFPARLSQNHPNPFNPVTEISFQLAEAGPVSLKIFDAQGRLVRDLSTGSYAAGSHAVTWNGLDHRGNSVSSGIYLYLLEAGGERLSKRMVLIK